MVHHRPGRIRFRIRLASRRDESFFEGDELPPLRQPKPGRPARIITRAEEVASNAAWARAALHRKFRGAVGWTEATGMGLYGTLLLMLLGRQLPDAPLDGPPLAGDGVPVTMAARGGADPAARMASTEMPGDAGAEVSEAGFGAAAQSAGLPRGLHGTGGGLFAAARGDGLGVPGEAAGHPGPQVAAAGEAATRPMPAGVKGGVEEVVGAVMPASFRIPGGEGTQAESVAAARAEAAKAAALTTKVAQAENAKASTTEAAPLSTISPRSEAAPSKMAEVAPAKVVTGEAGTKAAVAPESAGPSKPATVTGSESMVALQSDAGSRAEPQAGAALASKAAAMPDAASIGKGSDWEPGTTKTVVETETAGTAKLLPVAAASDTKAMAAGITEAAKATVASALDKASSTVAQTLEKVGAAGTADVGLGTQPGKAETAPAQVADATAKVIGSAETTKASTAEPATSTAQDKFGGTLVDLAAGTKAGQAAPMPASQPDAGTTGAAASPSVETAASKGQPAVEAGVKGPATDGSAAGHGGTATVTDAVKTLPVLDGGLKIPVASSVVEAAKDAVSAVVGAVLPQVPATGLGTLTGKPDQGLGGAGATKAETPAAFPVAGVGTGASAGKATEAKTGADEAVKIQPVPAVVVVPSDASGSQGQADQGHAAAPKPAPVLDAGPKAPSLPAADTAGTPTQAGNPHTPTDGPAKAGSVIEAVTAVTSDVLAAVGKAVDKPADAPAATEPAKVVATVPAVQKATELLGDTIGTVTKVTETAKAAPLADAGAPAATEPAEVVATMPAVQKATELLGDTIGTVTKVTETAKAAPVADAGHQGSTAAAAGTAGKSVEVEVVAAKAGAGTASKGAEAVQHQAEAAMPSALDPSKAALPVTLAKAVPAQVPDLAADQAQDHLHEVVSLPAAKVATHPLLQPQPSFTTDMHGLDHLISTLHPSTKDVHPAKDMLFA